MKTKIYILFFAIFALLVSCQLRQEYNIKNDLSGNYKLTVDFSELAKNDSLKHKQTSDKLEDINKIINVLKSIQGLSNFKYSDDGDTKGIVSYSYNFDNFESLNKSLKESKLTDLNISPPTFKKSFGKIIYQRPKIESINDEKTKLNFSSMFNFTSSISFENKIKKVKTNLKKNYTVDENTITEKGNFSEMYSNNRKFKISLKK